MFVVQHPVQERLGPGVKHLNPRQGITTLNRVVARIAVEQNAVCETPKSPPGDYNDDYAPIRRTEKCCLV